MPWQYTSANPCCFAFLRILPVKFLHAVGCCAIEELRVMPSQNSKSGPSSVPSSSSPSDLSERAREILRTLETDYRDFNPPIVPTVSWLSPLQFSKIVHRGQPTVIESSGTSNDPQWPWKASSWSRKDLEGKVKQPVEVAVTPSGNADALVDLTDEHASSIDRGTGFRRVFLQPANQQLTLSDLLAEITPSTTSPGGLEGTPVYYLQSQNSNLDTEALSQLQEDLPSNFDFAVDVLGQPDARNIWIGDHRSVTSVHRDPYENLYLVLRGSKTFRLWSPINEINMPVKMVSTGRYEITKDSSSPEADFKVVMDEDSDQIPWVDLDPLAASSDPGLMRVVTVTPGQILYLPSGWYHHVSQQCGVWDDGSPAPCIAVNYWYDMDYEGEKYVMRQLLSRLVDVARHSTSTSEQVFGREAEG